MDILGKKAEEAREGVEQVSDQVEELESHLDAVDSALQDHMETSESLISGQADAESSQTEEIQMLAAGLEELSDRVQKLESGLENVKDRQEKNSELLEQLADSEVIDTMERARKLVDSANKRYYDLQEAVESLESRLNELENDFVMEVNSREFDFGRKVNRSEFESKTQELRDEVSKLRASLNVLADEKDVEVEEAS